MNDGLNDEVEIPSSINLFRSDTKIFKSVIAESIMLQDADFGSAKPNLIPQRDSFSGDHLQFLIGHS